MNRRTGMSIIAALVLLGLLAALSGSTVGLADTSGLNSWTKRGPQHNIASGDAPEVVPILIQASNPSIVYVGTNQGMYRSTDGGESWQPRNGGLGGYGDLVVTGLVMHPTDPQTLFISTWGYGLFRSTDSGATWTRLTDPLPSSGAQGNAAGPLAPPVVVAGGYSYDDGRSRGTLDVAGKWQVSGSVLPPREIQAGEDPLSPLGLPVDLSWTPVRRVAIHPNNANELYACIDNGEGLYRSTDGGSSWAKINLGTGSARTYTFAPSNAQIRYASFGTWTASGGFFRTTNGGASWTPVGSGSINGTVTAVAIHPTNPNTVLAATSDDGLYRSPDGGNTWVPEIPATTEADFYAVAFAPSNGNIAYAGGLNWVYVSLDGGATWGNADPSFPTYYVEGLAIHPTQPQTVLVGANRFPKGGVYKRTSSGAVFALKATGMSDTFVLDIEQDPYNANILYAATWGGGVFRSNNGGLTWLPRYAVPYIYALEATQSGGSTVLYAGTFYSTYGVLRSNDRGDSWAQVSSGYSSDISFDLKSVDGGPNRLVAATYHGVEYTANGGATWQDASGLDAGIVLKLARSPTNPNKLLAATYGGGIWTSTNAGQTWTETSSGLGSPYVYSIAFSLVDPNLVYAGSYGIYRSQNGGSTWAPSGGLTTWIRSLDTLGGLHPDAFAGTHDRGVYMAPDGGRLWTPINSGLTDLRIRSIQAVASNKLFAGTNGSSAWEYTIATRPRLSSVYLPVVLRSFGQASLPPPTLHAISNSDLDGSYTVNWSSVSGATSYLLQEDQNASFSSPTTVYSGPGTSKNITGQADGAYYYRVRASNSYATSAWSNTQSVTVQTAAGGFYSDFNGSAAGWVSHSGTWGVDSQYLVTYGLPGTSSSVSYAEDFSDLDYQARVMREGCDLCANRLIVRGTPYPLSSSNHWYNEYVFQYTRNGYFMVTKKVTGDDTAILQDWTVSAAINPWDAWNILRVVANGSTFAFYINGTLVWVGSDASMSAGRVGLGMYRSADSTGDVFRADWASLSTLGLDGTDVPGFPDAGGTEEPAPSAVPDDRPGGTIDMAPPDS
jgi:photosystem II stability/assembly factor-like uncharacterized protein